MKIQITITDELGMHVAEIEPALGSLLDVENLPGAQEEFTDRYIRPLVRQLMFEAKKQRDNNFVIRKSGWLCPGILPSDSDRSNENIVEPKIEPAPIQITQAMADQVVETAGSLI